MWGCVKWIGIVTGVFLLLLFIGMWGFWEYIGTPGFAERVKNRIELNLQAKLGRGVTIGKVTFIQERPARLIIENLRIANAPGALRPHFAIVRRIEITGGVESFLNRAVQLGRVEVTDPEIYFEVFPAGAPLRHNWPRWKRAAPRRFEIVRVDINKLLIRSGLFHFNDRRHNIEATVTELASDIDPAFRQGIYEGIATSPVARVRIQDYETFDLNLRGGFFYRPGSLSLRSVALRGRGINAFVKGMVDPVSDAVYNLELNSKVDLERVREIFRLEQALDGDLTLTGNLKGKSGDFSMAADFVLPEVVADTYELSDLRGVMRVSDERTDVDIRSGRYGGGTISADYVLTKYAEPYPMSVDLRYNRISVEKLFADWNVQNTGLRGGASGSLHYEWNKNDLLAGIGSGTAVLNRGAVAFGNARYPIPVAGQTRFALNRGVITFAPSTLSTDSSQVSFDGSLRIEGLVSDLDVRVRSSDFGELDRLSYNFAHSAGKRDYELLGLGGSGTIVGKVRGEIGEPNLIAHISGSGVRYNNAALGTAEIDLRYDGPRGVLTFDRGVFRDGDATMSLAGTITFPDRGPSPRFNLDVEAANFPIERALQAVELDFAVSGIGTGKLHVEGSPDDGLVDFDDLRLTRNGSRLSLNGIIDWSPGEGDVTFDLDIGADSYPVSELLAFLEMKNIPVTGALTGTLHLEGPKSSLAGAGMVTVRQGTVLGEPIDLATADLVFTEGRLKATHVEVQSPAGTISGEAEVDLNNERFSYVIQSAELDASKLKAFAALNRFFNGRLRITSSGAGTFDRPEVVVEATLLGGEVQGKALPADAPPPTFYFATREGRLVIRGSGLGALTINGDGVIAPDGTLEGSTRIEVTDLARLIAFFAPTSEFPASGSFVVDLDLGGKLTPMEALEIRGTVPSLDVRISEQRITAAEPIRFAVDNGRVEILSYNIVTDGSNFSAEGFVSLVGNKEINIRVSGVVAAALIQLFAPDVRADGRISLAAGVTGTLQSPRIEGSAEFQDAQVKFTGFPQLIDGITGTLVFQGDRLELDSLRATLGGGAIVAGGSVTLDGLKPQRVRLNVQGTDVSLRYFEGVTVDGDFNMVLSGEVDRMVLQGEVLVDQAVYFKDIDFTTQVLNLILERGTLLPEVAASWQDRISLAVTLQAPGTIAVRNNLADITGSAELELTGTLANPVILGQVDIDEGGEIRLQDKEYEVVRGTINFANPFRTDPVFDITAETRQGEYLLTINLSGTLENIRPTVTSDPPASDMTLASLLGIGLPGEGNGSSSGLSQFSTFSNLILVQGLGLVGSRVLPFADAVRLEGLLDPTRPSVTFEKQINSDIRVIVTYFTGGDDQSRNIEVVEWQVTPDWVLQFTHDTDIETTVLISAVSARFRRRYEGRW